MSENDLSDVDLQNINREIVRKYARSYIELAVSTLGDCAANPKAQMGQVKACELIIEWTAGKPGTFVDIPGFEEGADVSKALDAVLTAVLCGRCSIETAEALIALLKRRSTVS